MGSVLDLKGNNISLRDAKLSFSNSQSDIFISGPNEQFLKAIHQAFKIDACYSRYGADIHRTYKRFIIFTMQGLPKHAENDLINWISYLRLHQEPKDEAEFNLI